MIHSAFANKCLQLAVAKTKSIAGTGYCYLGLSATEADEDGKRIIKADGSNFKEPDSATYPSYKRIQMSVTEALTYTDKWGSVSGGIVSNNVEVTSRECLEETGWPEFYHFGIFESQTGGSPIASGVLRDPDGIVDEETGLLPEKSLVIEPNKVAVFRAGTIQLTFR